MASPTSRAITRTTASASVAATYPSVVVARRTGKSCIGGTLPALALEPEESYARRVYARMRTPRKCSDARRKGGNFVSAAVGWLFIAAAAGERGDVFELELASATEGTGWLLWVEARAPSTCRRSNIAFARSFTYGRRARSAVSAIVARRDRDEVRMVVGTCEPRTSSDSGGIRMSARPKKVAA